MPGTAGSKYGIHFEGLPLKRIDNERNALNAGTIKPRQELKDLRPMLAARRKKITPNN